MNLPNKITLFRVCLVPVFIVCHALGWAWAALAVFVIASLSDFVDGRIARKRNLVTNFGKLMDPLADKFIVAAAMVALTADGVLPVWFTVLVISREFAVTGLRQVALERSVVLAASELAKAKTVSQMVLVAFLWVPLPPHLAFTVITVTGIAAVSFFTVASAAEYFYKNREVLRDL